MGVEGTGLESWAEYANAKIFFCLSITKDSAQVLTKDGTQVLN